jgi:hypothetical protein
MFASKWTAKRSPPSSCQMKLDEHGSLRLRSEHLGETFDAHIELHDVSLGARLIDEPGSSAGSLSPRRAPLSLIHVVDRDITRPRAHLSLLVVLTIACGRPSDATAHPDVSPRASATSASASSQFIAAPTQKARKASL